MLRFEVSADAYAMWREAVAQLRQESGGQLDEDDAFLMMARHVLGGPQDPGRSSYQVAMTICERCRQGFQQGRGESIPVGDEIVEMALCDAQHIGHVGGCDTHVGVTLNRKSRRALQAIPLERFERAFAALRGLGFKDGETKRALAEVRSHVGGDGAVEALVREGLRVLTGAWETRCSAAGRAR